MTTCDVCGKCETFNREELIDKGWNGCSGSINNLKVNVALCPDCFTPELMLNLMKGKGGLNEKR